MWGMHFAWRIPSLPHYRVYSEHDLTPNYGQVVCHDSPVDPWHSTICFKRVVLSMPTADAYCITTPCMEPDQTACLHVLGRIAHIMTQITLLTYISLICVSFLQSHKKTNNKTTFLFTAY